jgi:hypothetical protein
MKRKGFTVGCPRVQIKSPAFIGDGSIASRVESLGKCVGRGHTWTRNEQQIDSGSTRRHNPISFQEHERAGRLLRVAEACFSELGEIVGDRRGILARDIDQILKAHSAIDRLRPKLETLLVQQYPRTATLACYRCKDPRDSSPPERNGGTK